MGRLPLPVLYVKASFLAFLLCHVIGYRKKVVHDNIRRSFPDADTQTLNAYTREFYRRFTDFAVETLRIGAMGEKAYREHCTITWDPELQPLIDNEEPFLILTSHVFNWEWTLQRISFELKQPFAAVYQKLSSLAFDNYMSDIRQTNGASLIEKNDLIRYLARNRKPRHGIAILADQTPLHDTRKYWTTFMNQDTAFYLGPQLIAYITGMPAFYYQVRRQRRGHYNIHVAFLSNPPEEKGSTEIIEKYARALERTIREDPPGYLWSHRRWKLARPARKDA